MIRPPTFLALVAALAVNGCRDPYTSDHRQPAPARPATAASSPGDTAAPGPPAPPVGPAEARASRGARAVARSFATRWINWDWQTAAKQQRELAQLANDDLARTLRANASSARIDATLARDKPGSRGTVAAIQLKRTTAAIAAGIVVTREQSYTGTRSELGGRRYRVYLVQLRRQRSRWEVSRWVPQP